MSNSVGSFRLRRIRRCLRTATFPELKLASRLVGRLILHRLGRDPEKSRAEMEEFDAKYPGEMIYN